MSICHLSHDDHVSQAHFSFSQGLVLHSWACVLLCSCLSLGYLLCCRVIFVTCFDRESCWIFFCFQKLLFWWENFKYCQGIIMWLFTIDAGDYRWLPSSVVCCILFKDINSCSGIWSPSMSSAGRQHFHVPCPASVLFWLLRSATAMLFVKFFTLFTIVSIAAE